ncbi:IS1182 family transposase ISBch1 [Sporomusa rhizae]|uniref:IS1182 family transposase n=1 Tax=Sporomusa rhizae TaxID=357999 RepID=UPI00352BB764
MLKSKSKQLTLYSILYDKIPDNHILRNIEKAVDFSFINKLLEKSYSKRFGRPAKEPETMAKLLILQYLYNLSDVKIIEEASLNLAYMWFIGINPDEDLPDPSLLAKFRTQRLKDNSVDDIIKEVVRQCIEQNIIKGTGVSIDATHAAANTTKLVPERIMARLAKTILKNVVKESGEIPSGINSNIPDYKVIEDTKEAKRVMKDYLEGMMAQLENTVNTSNMLETEQAITEAREILGDEKFIIQKGIRSLVDKDARVGYKSKTDSFYGYKIEFAMMPEERIITAIETCDGAYVDGNKFDKLYNRSKECGVTIKEVYGDKAYFRKPILDILRTDKVEAIIPISASVYKIDESTFSYNKDSDQWFCRMGNYTIDKKHKKCGKGSWAPDNLRYIFDKAICMGCPHKMECAGKAASAKRLDVGINTADYYEHSQRAQTQEFKEKYKKRASHEWKNGEMKRFHGLDRARGYGLRSMSMQAKLTALAVNLKRIAALVSLYLRIWGRISSKVPYWKIKLPVYAF